ncbi:MAG: DUF502 domain-containing protein [Alphaproteobacteria bacterium]|jgi:uncharacterized membrane protein|nr:DUF502 domain-containing protein [Alphaproteobacteria bacterium]MDP6589502.1 DUF502 domain-containing protein [Alphaproteobacteria bacterium]MDP6819257.1 DUF502 domain-containing protein [Alphaproteobacteria bacterium]
MNAKKTHSDSAPGGEGRERPVLIKPARKRGLLARLRTYFLTGIVVSAPVGITIWLIWLFVAFVDRTVVPLIPESYNPSNVLGVSVPGIGVIVVLLAVTIIGFMVTNFFGRFMVKMGENMVSRVPVVRTIYGVLKQIFDAVLAQSEGAFREVILIEYPRKGIWVIGFITSNTQGEVQRVTPEEMVNVFLPTTPNPTSGFLLFVPRVDCITLDMTVEEGVKLVISGGIVSPPDPKAAPPPQGEEAEQEDAAQAERK